MKKQQTTLYLILALSVFVISFFVGRATALKNAEEERKNATYTGRILIPEKEEAKPAGAEAEKIEVLDEFSEKVDKKTENKKQEVKKTEIKKEAKKEITEGKKEEETPPERMLFPCRQAVLKKYSQSAVYSKTMDDWRAHTGIDYKAEVGEEVKSAWDGTVTRIYKDNYWGHCIEISHSGNITSVYRNLDEKIKVKEGENINRGQVIALVGTSAVIEKRDEAHLHFEILFDGVPINPESYVY